ncbi:MAG TPA: alpha/beta hydrolase-fold protein [Gemmatales bacterium]|nr:alpha/beta hydrolase-fold protein [Gemmatales bacterium]
MLGEWTWTPVGPHVADLYRPAGQSGAPVFGLIFLHGVGGESLRGQEPFTRVLDELNWPCLCPWGGQTWWTDRLLPEYHAEQSAESYLLHDVLDFCREHWRLAPPRLALAGISMGGQGALRLGFKRPETFPVVGGIAPAIEYHQLMDADGPLDRLYTSPEQCRQDTVPMHVQPQQFPAHIGFWCDPDDALWHRGNDRLHEKLAALGVPHECDLTTRAGGHDWTYFGAMAQPLLHFLHRGLVEQSRRLL